MGDRFFFINHLNNYTFYSMIAGWTIYIPHQESISIANYYQHKVLKQKFKLKNKRDAGSSLVGSETEIALNVISKVRNWSTIFTEYNGG